MIALFLTSRPWQSKTLKTSEDLKECEGIESADSVLRQLRLTRLRLSPTTETVLVESGPGCLRGCQGSNGAMWIVRFDRGRVTVLASPDEDFQCYVYCVQTTANKGYRDIVVGWHNSAFEVGLANFRFDGTRYRRLSKATATWNDDGKETTVPDK